MIRSFPIPDEEPTVLLDELDREIDKLFTKARGNILIEEMAPIHMMITGLRAKLRSQPNGHAANFDDLVNTLVRQATAIASGPLIDVGLDSAADLTIAALRVYLAQAKRGYKPRQLNKN